MQLQSKIGIRKGKTRMLYVRIIVYLIWIGWSRVRERFPEEVTFRLQPKH